MGAIKVGVGLTAAVILAAFVLAALAARDSSSTAALAFVFIPLYAFIALIVIWIGVLVALAIRRGAEDRRFAKRNANPSY